MKTIERDPTVQPQTAAAVGAEVRSRTPFNDRIAARRLEGQIAQSNANGGFPLLAPGHKQPVRTTETWSLSTRSEAITSAVALFAIGAGTLPIAIALNPGVVFMWLFLGPFLIIAAIARLQEPYELLVFPSGR